MGERNTYHNIQLALLMISSLIFCFHPSRAQDNFLPGYVVTLNGDTLRGFVDYRNWDQSPRSIDFKGPSGVRTSYACGLIQSFSVADERYVSAIVDTEVSRVNTKAIDHSPDLVFQTDTAFIQTIVGGEKSLYFHKNTFGKEQFYIRQGQRFELLIYKKYLKALSEADVVIENKKYIGQLISYLGDLPALKSSISKARYSKKSLENIFIAYYGSSGVKARFEKKTEKISWELGALAGVALTSTTFTGSYHPYLSSVSFPVSVNGTVGVSFDLVFPRNRSKWSINNEMMSGAYHLAGTYESYTDANRYTITTSSLGTTYFKINNLLRYRLLTGPTKVYATAGVSHEWALQETNNKSEFTKFYTSETTQTGKALDFTKKYGLQVLAGAGMRWMHYSFEVRYESGNGISDTFAVGSSTNRVFFLLGYTFKKPGK
jgi:hypothetical protein